MCFCVEGACEEVDWGWDVELVDGEEQGVVLTLRLLLELSIWASVGDTIWILLQLYDFHDLYTFLQSLFD